MFQPLQGERESVWLARAAWEAVQVWSIVSRSLRSTTPALLDSDRRSGISSDSRTIVAKTAARIAADMLSDGPNPVAQV